MNVQHLFGANLKRCRQRANLSQIELASRLGITPSAVFNIEAGTRFVSEELLQHLIDTLHILPEELFYSGPEQSAQAIHADVLKKVIASHLDAAGRSLMAQMEA
jgi:transcriptional regulator with XRE-family HTH domain